MIIIAGQARLRPDRLEDALRAGSEMAILSRSEDGCEDYRFSVDLDDPTVIRLFELWASPEALAAHFQMPHFAAFSAAMPDFLAEQPEFTRYEVASSGPLMG